MERQSDGEKFANIALTPSLSLTHSLPLPLTLSLLLSNLRQGFGWQALSLSLLLSLITLFPNQIYAQLSTPDLSFESYGIISSSGTTPFWLQSNRHGMFSSEGSQFLTRIQAHSTNNQLTNNLTLSYGADFIARPVTQPTAHFNQGYVRLDAWNLFLQAGRFHNTSPIHDEELGMGSLGVSGNATPIPQIRAGLSDWTSIPFTRDFILIKGHIAHGWLDSERYVSDVLYHEKVGHARFGGDFPLNLYGGIAQYVLWGGISPERGPLPNTFEDFARVTFALSAPEGSREGSDYIIGDQKGAWDFGFFLELNAFDIKVYRQFPLETKDNLKLKSLQDALTGITIQPAEHLNFPLTKLNYEFLYTKYQDGPRVPEPEGLRDSHRGNENYYNHGVYRTGWVYNGMTIGNPLFVPSSDLRIGVYNNRVVAHHLGVSFQLTETIKLSTKGTYSRNYGKRWDNRIPDDPEKNDLFNPSVNQWSFYAGLEIPAIVRNFPVNILVQAGFDDGLLVSDQFGMLFGIKWKL